MQNSDKLKILQHIPIGAKGAEVGVHLGQFSQVILDVIKPDCLYLIDPWIAQDRPGSWYDLKKVKQDDMDKRYCAVKKRFANIPNIQIIRKKSIQIDNQIKDNELDFVYLDGDHSYEGVCTDFDIFYKKVKPGGYILGDDYFKGKWWGDSIIKAVERNLREKDLEITEILGNQFCLKVVKTDNQNNL